MQLIYEQKESFDTPKMEGSCIINLVGYLSILIGIL